MMELAELIRAEESAWLDRKGAYPSNRVELLHDILCLANAYADTDRFLLFGVADDRRVLGVTRDPNRLTNAQFQDFLTHSNLNRIPTVELLHHRPTPRKEIDVLRIVNRPDKPFFVTRDKSYQGKILRNGVIYTRVGDTNTPLPESAPEEMIELMWRERFGLGLPALQRFHRLLDQPAAWVRLPGQTYRYHSLFPEFTVQRGETLNEDFREKWAQKFPDPHAWSFHLDVRYLTTVLERFAFVACDGGRYQIPFPRLAPDGSFVLDRNSPAMKLALQLEQYWHDLEEALSFVGVRLE